MKSARVIAVVGCLTGLVAGALAYGPHGAIRWAVVGAVLGGVIGSVDRDADTALSVTAGLLLGAIFARNLVTREFGVAHPIASYVIGGMLGLFIGGIVGTMARTARGAFRFVAPDDMAKG